VLADLRHLYHLLKYLVLEAILKNYPEHPKTLELLIDRANNDPDEQLREFAKRQLAKLEKQQ
jgi:hypothetical protein